MNLPNIPRFDSAKIPTYSSSTRTTTVLWASSSYLARKSPTRFEVEPSLSIRLNNTLLFWLSMESQLLMRLNTTSNFRLLKAKLSRWVDCLAWAVLRDQFWHFSFSIGLRFPCERWRKSSSTYPYRHYSSPWSYLMLNQHSYSVSREVTLLIHGKL